MAGERVIPGYGGGMSSAKAALEADTRTLAYEAGRRYRRPGERNLGRPLGITRGERHRIYRADDRVHHRQRPAAAADPCRRCRGHRGVPAELAGAGDYGIDRLRGLGLSRHGNGGGSESPPAV